MAGLFTGIILLAGEAVNRSMQLIQNLQHESSIILIVLAGTAGMLLAIGFGVWASIRIGIGPHAKRRKAFTWWVINRLAFLAAAVNVATFVLFYIQERFEEYSGNLAASPAAIVLMVVGVLILALAIPSGWLADRFGKKKLVAASGLLAAFGTAAALLAPGISGLYIGGLFIGAGVGLFYTANWALGTEIVPDDQAGRYFGLSNLAGAGAGAVGAYIGGPIADNQGYVLLFTIFGLLFLVSSLALWGVRGYKES
jgi:MFS family permease